MPRRALVPVPDSARRVNPYPRGRPVVKAVIQDFLIRWVKSPMPGRSAAGAALYNVRRTVSRLEPMPRHGVPAGVFMAMIKSAIRTRLLGAHALETLVADLNEVLVQVTGPSMFATFACLHVEAPRRVTVALAGHLPVLHFETATGRLHLVHNEHPPLGIVAGQRFATTAVAAAAGDLFVLFTDGLTEVRNEAGQEFGEERLQRLVAENAQRPLAALHAALLGAVRDFGPQHDDQTLVLMRLL